MASLNRIPIERPKYSKIGSERTRSPRDPSEKLREKFPISRVPVAEDASSLASLSTSSSSSSSFSRSSPSATTSLRATASGHPESPKLVMIDKILKDLDWLEKYLSGERSEYSMTYNQRQSRSLVDFMNSQAIGNQRLQRASLPREYGMRRLLQNQMYAERTFDLDQLNKVFCSQWLNDRQVAFGTKCNKVMVVDVISGKTFQIPNLTSSSRSLPAENPCGIHAMEINPSKTLLATGGENANDIAIYKLPTLDPVCVGEGGHSDWVFDLKWLDDEFLVTGSRDSTIALWRVDSENQRLCDASSLVSNHYYNMSPLLVKSCKSAQKIRGLLFNDQFVEIIALSLNAQLHIFDAQTLKQKYSKRLPYYLENVCLAQELKHGLYAVGSKSNITLVDYRTLEPAAKIFSKHYHSGIRSLTFSDHILTIGTGIGSINFYDIRANNYIEESFTRNAAELQAAKGFIFPDDAFYDVYMNLDYAPAIYTHQYDTSGTRLFAAGGPLPASLHGNYAALWS